MFLSCGQWNRQRSFGILTTKMKQDPWRVVPSYTPYGLSDRHTSLFSLRFCCVIWVSCDIKFANDYMGNFCKPKSCSSRPMNEFEICLFLKQQNHIDLFSTNLLLTQRVVFSSKLCDLLIWKPLQHGTLVNFIRNIQKTLKILLCPDVYDRPHWLIRCKILVNNLSLPKHIFIFACIDRYTKLQ